MLLLQPNLKRVDLPLRKRLEQANKPIDYVYFLESGFASVVAGGSGGGSIEIGLIGREGVTGCPVLMGTDRSPHETFIQSAGEGLRISAGSLRRAMEHSRTLHRTLLLYTHAFALQVTHTAIANGRSKIEQRLARWLLMAQDRIGQDEVFADARASLAHARGSAAARDRCAQIAGRGEPGSGASRRYFRNGPQGT